ncbi:hypothetical protein HMPREF1548_00873 [Clostridium sp. KLE 1755]|nr:hypothetical protein HMPREF1548_00873 [Clostridium sp. KLE 1755]
MFSYKPTIAYRENFFNIIRMKEKSFILLFSPYHNAIISSSEKSHKIE